MASTSKKSKSTASKEEESDSWDIDYYRAEYESEEHWNLRRNFMVAHKDKFSEDQLVCLAQVFINMEFMGCKYPADTMRRVGELSQEVAKEFRAQRAKKLKRTFVTASDAAEQRAKGRRTTQQQQQGDQHEQSGSNRNAFAGKRKRFGTGEWESEQPQTKRGAQSSFFDGLPYGQFVLFLSGGRNCIRTSAQRCNMEFQEKEVGRPGEKKKVEYYIDNKLIVSAEEENVKASKAQAFTQALDLLRKSCYSIKPNPLQDTIKIDKTNNQVVCGVTKPPAESLDDKKLDSTNKGYKMMKMMGWSGGGLGSKTQGREDPVGYLLKNNRAGLGNQACKLDRKYFTQMLQNYIESVDIRELQFESSFTKDERAMLHEIAGKYNLKSTSHGKGDDRRLIICKKTITNDQILTEVLLNKNPTYCDKYFVAVPESRAKLYPDHTVLLELDL